MRCIPIGRKTYGWLSPLHGTTLIIHGGGTADIKEKTGIDPEGDLI